MAKRRHITNHLAEQTKCQRLHPHHIPRQLCRIDYWHLRPQKRLLLLLWLDCEAEACTKCSYDGRRGLCISEGCSHLKKRKGHH